jgi:hypothetical protein
MSGFGAVRLAGPRSGKTQAEASTMGIHRTPDGPRCQSCGRPPREHRHVYPARSTPQGPIYFDCWGAAERGLSGRHGRQHD